LKNVVLIIHSLYGEIHLSTAFNEPMIQYKQIPYAALIKHAL